MQEPAEGEEEFIPWHKRCGFCCMYHWRGWFIVLLPTVACPLLFLKPVLEYRCAYVLVLMAFFWVTEAIPLYVTSLFPIVFFPLMGIMSSDAICLSYFTSSLILFFGGMILALAIEHSNLHKRVGLRFILLVGCSPRKLHLSLICITMFTSMWISNSAATAMMCPVIKAVLEELSASGMAEMVDETKEVGESEPPYPSKTVLCYYLGVAYAASTGGCGTLIGTGTNLTFKGIYDTRFPEQHDVDFMPFMYYNFLPMIVHTLLVWLWLQLLYMGLFRPNSPQGKAVALGTAGADTTRQVIKSKYDELGPFSCHEKQVSIMFLLMIVLFVTYKPNFVKGWGDFLNAVHVKSASAVILVTILIFSLPINYVFMKYWICKKPDPEGTLPSLLIWDFVQKTMPWGLLLLLGGGFGLAAGIKASGFAVMVGQALTILKPMNPIGVQFICIFFGIFATNFSANLAMCNILMPVLLEMSVAIEVHPLYLALPTAMGLSMAFHFPVSTPPNAIVAGFANIRTKDMMIAGIGPSLITLFGYFLASQSIAYLIFHNYGTFPEWARHNVTTKAPPTVTTAP